MIVSAHILLVIAHKISVNVQKATRDENDPEVGVTAVFTQIYVLINVSFPLSKCIQDSYEHF